MKRARPRPPTSRDNNDGRSLSPLPSLRARSYSPSNATTTRKTQKQQDSSNIETADNSGSVSAAAAAAAAAVATLPQPDSVQSPAPVLPLDCGDASMLPTPHMMRLLQLVHNGTAAQAVVAAQKLRESCQQVHAVTVWHVLGCLGTSLSHSRWSTRTQAADALRDLAANYLPGSDVTAFWQQQPPSSPSLSYLTVAQLAAAVDTVLQDGRRLYGRAEAAYNDDDDDPRDDDDAALNNDATLQDADARVHMQRQILAQRLGLARLEQVVGRELFDDDDAAAALGKSNKTIQRRGKKASQTKTEPKKKRRRRKKKTDKFVEDNSDNDDNRAPNDSIRWLLVRQVQQHQSQAASLPPQTLLATELLYNMYDARWQVRHGALLGLAALVKAWWQQQRPPDNDNNNDRPVWLEDCLVKTIGVLMLDRFGDFSGASLGAVVGPVREAAAQLVSLLTQMMPTVVQQEALALLCQLALETGVRDWEVCHGAMLALKYMCAVASDSRRRHGPRIDDSNIVAPWDRFVQIACHGLAATNDDIKGVSAQLLVQVITACSEAPKSVWRASRSVVTSLEQVGSLSSCIPDLLALLTTLVSSDATRFLSELVRRDEQDGSMVTEYCRLVSSLAALMRAEYESVRLAALQALTALVPHAPAGTTDVDERAINKTRCDLMENTFGLFYVRFELWDDPAALCSHRTALWSTLTPSNASEWVAHQRPLLTRMLEKYFGFSEEETKDPNTSFEARIAAADAIATLCNTLTDNCATLAVTYCALFSRSTFVAHCESAFLLYLALWKIQRWSEMSTASSYLCEDARCILSSKSLYSATTTASVTAITAIHKLASSIEGGYCDQSAAIESARLIWKTTSKGSAVREVAGDWGNLRSRAVAAGTCVMIGQLQQNATVIAHALMNSFRNESGSRRKQSGRWLVRLVQRLNATDGCADLLRYVMTSICDIVCDEVVDDDYDDRGDGSALAAVLLQNVCSELDDRTLQPTNPAFRVIQENLERLLAFDDAAQSATFKGALLVLQAVAKGVTGRESPLCLLVQRYVPAVVASACCTTHEDLKGKGSKAIVGAAEKCENGILQVVIDELLRHLTSNDDLVKAGACEVLRHSIEDLDTMFAEFVRLLLPVVMSLMTNRNECCAKNASAVFARLVRLAPLAPKPLSSNHDTEADSVIDHLIVGEPLPPISLPIAVLESLTLARVQLRPYQQEGVSWLRFLQSVKLNGALCDSMGLGKTLQSLIAIAIAHSDDRTDACMSLVVCPSSIQGQWCAETLRFFPDGQVLRPLVLAGSSSLRRKMLQSLSPRSNLIITSYSTLRSDIDLLSVQNWCYCVLDEGHLLKNPKTATAQASKKLQAMHRLILTGTPVQNRVLELHAIFDFLMPNFLGTAQRFGALYAKPIDKGHREGANAEAIAESMEKLKVLHQQVLPFILRREKEDVLKELPPKNIMTLKVPMSRAQLAIHTDFSQRSASSTPALFETIASLTQASDQKGGKPVGPEMFKSLLFMRLLCTHPCLVLQAAKADDNIKDIAESGKLQALLDLLREAGILEDKFTAADNDTTLLYADDTDQLDTIYGDSFEGLSSGVVAGANRSDITPSSVNRHRSKVLIFAQFTQSLDLVEELVLRPHLSQAGFLRLDGRVPAPERSRVAQRFNEDARIRVLLLTTRVGSLGLNLTGADTVIFLESDYNPFADLQAMDRTHRIGQDRTVNVYRLIVQDSIEERILQIQDQKRAMSDAVVNTDNSSMFSLGTDRLLDIFSTRRAQDESDGGADEFDLDALLERYREDYASFNVNNFMESLHQQHYSDEKAIGSNAVASTND